jgi:hypothetical protein
MKLKFRGGLGPRYSLPQYCRNQEDPQTKEVKVQEVAESVPSEIVEDYTSQVGSSESGVP